MTVSDTRPFARAAKAPHRWRGVCLSRSVCPAVPTGFAPDGLPIVGHGWRDPTPLKLAELIEREFGSFVPATMFDD
jgi:amidase